MARASEGPPRGLSRSVMLVAGAVVVVLVAFASGYGYHRDEL